MRVQLVKQYKENGFITVKDMANLFGITYMGMRHALNYNKITADMEVKRGPQTFYLYNKEKVLQLLAEAGYIPEAEQKSEQMIGI